MVTREWADPTKGLSNRRNGFGLEVDPQHSSFGLN